VSQNQAGRSAERRVQILTAAAHLFRQRGFVGVGIDDIGAAVGVSGPAVYRYFPSKQAVLAEIVRGYVRALGAECGRRAQAAARTGGDAAVERYILDSAITVGLRDPDGLVVYLRQLAYLDPADRESILADRKALADAWDSVLRSLHVDGALAARQLRLRCVAGVLIHVALTKLTTPQPREDLAKQMVTSILEVTLPDSLEQPHHGPGGESGVALRHASRREAILAASTRLFRERSFNGVSLRDIGAAVDISASAVNRHFESKEQLLATAFNRAAEQIAAGIAGAIGRAGTPAEAAVEIVTVYTQLAIECRDLIVINATEMHFLPESHRTTRRRNQRMYVEELAQMLAAARPELGVSECRIRAGCVFGLVNEAVMKDSLLRRPNLIDELTVMGLALLGLPADQTATVSSTCDCV